MRKGQINCVVVKDLSRFGRNHIEAGSYIEEVFPFLGVRFISVNDHYDSKDTIKKGQGLLLPLQNIVNEMYARDISAKVKSQLRLKQARGEYMGAFAPYGYLRDPNQTSRLIPDPQTAPIVGKIFALRAQGVSCQTIAELLTEEGIPPPSRYRRLQSDKHVEGLGHSCWHKSTIKRILTNPTYLGDMVQCKEQTSVFWGHRRKQMPPDQWVRVRATHTPIITQQDFLTVQASFQPKEYQ